MRRFLALGVVLAACSAPVPPGTCEPPVGRVVPNEGWPHVPEGSPLSPAHNPPASGPHYPSWAEYRIHAQPLARGHWIHNVEHGAVVFLFRSGAPQAAVDTLRQAYDELPDDLACGHKRALLTEDPLLDSNVAVVAADVVLEGDSLAKEDMLALAKACRNRAPESVCE